MDTFWTNVWSIVLGLFIFLIILWLIGAIISAIWGPSIKKNVQNLVGGLPTGGGYTGPRTT